MKKKIIAGAFVAIASVFALAAAPVQSVSATSVGDDCTNLSDEDKKAGLVCCPKGTKKANKVAETYAKCNLDDDSQKNDLMGTISVIINVIIGIIGLVAVVVIILGGFQYMTSSGDSTKVKKAKDTILYGIVGLVIALLAYAIVNFVLGAI
jgi:hypothetical protein